MIRTIQKDGGAELNGGIARGGGNQGATHVFLQEVMGVRCGYFEWHLCDTCLFLSMPIT